MYREDLYRARAQIADFLLATANSLQTRSRLAQGWQESLNALQQGFQRREEQGTSPDWLQGYACIQQAHAELQRMSRLLYEDKRVLGLTLPETWLRSPMPQIQRALEAIRANLTFHSATFRHAVRLGLALGVATFIYQFLPFSRGYWLPLTTLVILKPEFTTTISRGVARVLGTLIGSVLATLLLEIPDPTHLLGVVLIGVFLTGMYTVLNYNMVLFSGILTAEVVVLLSFFERTPLLMTINDRVIYTVAGSLLAFIAYAVWPTWQHKNIPNAMANLISAERQYLNAIFSTQDFSLAESLRKRTRLARTNVVNLVNQAMTEPVSGVWDEHAIHGLLTALNRFSDMLLSLEAYLAHERASLHGHAEIMEFGEYVNRCLLEIESDVHRSRDGAQTPSSLEIQLAEGTLDEVSPFTKQQLRELDIPASLAAILIRMEENLSTMFRVVAALTTAGPSNRRF